MPSLRSIRNILERLEKKWFAEKPPFSEAVITAALLGELFRGSGGLGFNERSARREIEVPTGDGCVDIFLKCNPKNSVIVEIKQPGMLEIGKRHWKTDLKQAGRYVRDYSQKYGILTDGLSWFYFRVLPYGRFYRVHPLVYFHIKTHRPLALRILQRSKKRSLIEFLDLLAAMHYGMRLDTFNDLMNLGIEERVEALVTSVKEQNVLVRSADRTIMSLLYGGAHANELIRPVLEPLRLTQR